MNIAQDLKMVSISLKCPELNTPNVVSTICTIIARYNKLETSEAYSIVLQYIPESIQAWKDGKAHNLSSAIYTRARFALLNAITNLRRRERIEMAKDTLSLDSGNEDTANLHESIADNKGESIDWKGAFNYFISNAGFTEREKEIFIGLKDGHTVEAIGNQFGVSKQAISLSKKNIEMKVNRIKSKVIG